LIIDPTVRLKAEDYYFDVNRRTGLRPGDVTHCFVTHHHLDHYEALQYFPSASWMAAKPVAEIIRKECELFDASPLAGVEGEFLPGVAAIPLPGHTDTLHGVAFSCGGKKILVAADSVMTRFHFTHETTDFQQDPEMRRVAAQTIRSMKESFDIVVPGHDNIIVI
jgi:glyoxylase-like metal-dependent hydrolase (beta-lactamase superfamily II)